MFIVIDNFLTQNECIDLFQLAESLPENLWNNLNNGSWNGKRAEIQHGHLKKIHTRVCDLFLDYAKINEISAIQRLRPGQDMGPHHDAIGGSDISFGCVAYINDDYRGGEILYKSKNIKIKPISGMLIIHSGDEEHSVLEVFEKTRYMLTTFVFSQNQQKKPKLIYVNT